MLEERLWRAHRKMTPGTLGGRSLVAQRQRLRPQRVQASTAAEFTAYATPGFVATFSSVNVDMDGPVTDENPGVSIVEVSPGLHVVELAAGSYSIDATVAATRTAGSGNCGVFLISMAPDFSDLDGDNTGPFTSTFSTALHVDTVSTGGWLVFIQVSPEDPSTEWTLDPSTRIEVS